MNILVRTYSAHVIVRPDTTWERDNEDFFVPQFVNSLSFTPVLFARVSKPGRSVSEKFASRYFDAVGCGVLLYPDDLIDGTPEGFACASCLDHTSFLSWPFFEPEVLDGSVFSLTRGGKGIFEDGPFSSVSIEKTLELVTRYCYIRTGDLIAIELSPRTPIASGQDSEIRVEGFFAKQKCLDFKIIF